MKKPFKTTKRTKKPHTFQLGKFDAAVIIRCKSFSGPITRQLLVPKGGEKGMMPKSTDDLLAMAILFGKSPASKQVRHIVQKQLELMSRLGKGQQGERPTAKH